MKKALFIEPGMVFVQENSCIELILSIDGIKIYVAEFTPDGYEIDYIKGNAFMSIRTWELIGRKRVA